MSKRFIFEVQTNHILSVDEIWPDGDAPENPTVEDAKEVFLSYCYDHDILGGLEEWNLAIDKHDLTVTELEEGVTFNGK
jgi:hypothetical protein